MLAAGSASAQPGFSKAFDVPSIAPGAISTLVFTIDNSDGGSPVTDLAFVDVFPAGTTVATPSQASTSCSGGRNVPEPTLSAPEGGDTVALSEATLAPGQTCTVRVNVTAATAGIYANVSGDLTSSAGNSGPAAADLEVVASRPGFTKTFSPSTVLLDTRSTLTFTVDNTENAANVLLINFSDSFPDGLVVADPANVTTTCTDTNLSPTINAAPGASTFSYAVSGFEFDGFRPLLAGETCAVSVDVTPTVGGAKENVTTSLATNFGPSGKAGAVLEVGQPGSLSANTVFTDDPATPGDVVTLLFRVFNRDRTRTYTDIAFTDDLEAVLPGLAPAAPLPTDPCGPGSTLSGTSVLTLAGGTLAAGESCAFRVFLQVPAGASPGAYSNVTSVLTALADGVPIVGSPGGGELIVTAAPALAKEFVDDPVLPGDEVTLRYALTNASTTSSATAIAFTDPLMDVLPFPLELSLPAGGFCGPSSTASVIFLGTDVQALQISNAELAAGASCSFDVGVTIPDGFAGGSYTSTTGTVSATVDGVSVSGPGATDVLEVVAVPTLTKRFESTVVPGGAVTLTFTIAHDANAADAAVDLAFTDDLGAVLPGLEAVGTPASDVCGTGSQLSGTSTLALSAGALAPGASCEFSVDLAVPAAAAAGTYANTTSDLTFTLGGTPLASAPASADLVVAPLLASKVFTDDPVMPGGSVTLEYTLTNVDASSAVSNILFQDAFNEVISGLAVTSGGESDVCGAGSAIVLTNANRTLVLAGGSLGPGATCTFDVTLAVPGSASAGSYPSLTKPISGSVDGNSFTIPGAVDLLEVAGNDPPAFSKAFAPDQVTVGGTTTLTLAIDNTLSTEAATGLDVTDPFPTGLVVATPANASTTCTGGTLTAVEGGGTVAYTGGTVDAGASCAVTVDVTAVASGTLVNVTGDLTSSLGNSGSATATLEVGGASVDPTKTDVLVDGNGNGFADEGETIRYVIALANDGVEATDDVVLTDLPDPNSTLVVGSVTTTAGTITTGNSAGDTSVAVDIGAIPGGTTVTVEFEVVVTPLVEEPRPICNRALVTVGAREIETDDPDTPDADATCTPTDQPPIDLVVTSFEAARGGDLVPQLTIENTTGAPITTQIRIIVQDPAGDVSRYRTRRGTIDPGGPIGPYPAGIVPVPSDAPAGTYTVLVTARRTAGNALLDDERFTFELAPAPTVTVEALSLTREAGLEATVSVAAPEGDARAYATRVTLEDPAGASTQHAVRPLEAARAALEAPLAAGAPDGTYRVRIEVVDPETDVAVATETVEVALGAAMATGGTAAAFANVEPGALPNPFRASTTLRYALEAEADVDLRVFDVTGREVAVLASGRQEAGLYTVPFEAAGRPAGVYVWRLVVDGEATVGQVTLVR